MSKKILSVVLALVLVMSASFTAFAASVGYEEEDATYTQEWALSEPVDNGDGTWTVDVSLKANYNVSGIQFTIENTDNTNVVLTSAVAGAGIPANWKATVTKSNTTGQVAINPKPTDDAVEGIAFADAAKVVATLTYTVASGKSAKINIKNDPKSATNPGGTLIAARTENNNVVTDADSPIVGQKVTSVGETRTLGAVQAEPADLAVAAAYADKGIVIDKAKTFGAYAGTVYGMTAITNYRKGDYLAASFTATNGGYIVVKNAAGTAYDASKNSTGAWGTKATIEVYNADDTLAKTYLVVIFGDVNGDGNINATDLSAIKKNNLKTAVFTDKSIEHFAANVNCGSARFGYTVNASDLSDLKKNNTRTALIVQSEKAALHVTYTYFNY